MGRKSLQIMWKDKEEETSWKMWGSDNTDLFYELKMSFQEQLKITGAKAKWRSILLVKVIP